MLTIFRFKPVPGLRCSTFGLLVIALYLAASPRCGFGQSASKAIVLAWDGVVPAFAQELLREGKLPNLAELIVGGAFAADVKPGFPSKTAPGFASLITGAPPRVTGISGNRVPRAPRAEFTILENLPGFSAAPLRAESIWTAARNAGKHSIISHMPTFAGEGAEGTFRFSGYTLIAGRDGIVTKSSAQSSAMEPWQNPPRSKAMPIEIRFSIGETMFFGLLIDDPEDDQDGYDTLALANRRDGDEIQVKLKPAPAGVGGELFWSRPIAVNTSKAGDAKLYFRLFDLKPDGSDFFLYHTRPVRDLPLATGDVPASPTVVSFVGNGASFLFQQGALGRTIPNGGSGSAEERYLETVLFAQHQLMETNRWAMTNLPWDLYFAYSPFPDEAEHLWRGYLESSLPTYRPELAERLRGYLERVYRSTDEHLGLLLNQRPADALFALISDHGLQGIDKRVALNPALQRAGLLALDNQGRVDLSKTKVLYPAVNNGYLLINSKDRKAGVVDENERAGLIAEVRQLLLTLRDGERQIVKAVFDAAIEGPAMGIGGDVGGDIYVELAPGYDFDPRISAGALITAAAQPYGNHGANPEQEAMRTLMVFNGPGIRPGQRLTGVRLIDFAPTLARLLNLPKPRDATGQALFQAWASPR